MSGHDYVQRVGARVRAVRIAQGKSLRQVAADTNGVVSHDAISQFERGRDILLGNAIAIANALGDPRARILDPFYAEPETESAA